MDPLSGERMLELIDHWLLLTGPWLLVFLGVAALLEYVFPPFPGDTVTLLGAYAAVIGQTSFPEVYAAVTVGSLLGASLSYGAGRVLARSAPPSGRAGRWLSRVLSPELLSRVAVQYRRFGPWIILANRFVPVTRSIFFVFAGMTGIPYTRTLLLGGISAAAWNAMLLAIGYSIGTNRDALAHALDDYTRAAWVVLGLVAFTVGTVIVVRRTRRNRSPKQGPSKSLPLR